MIYNVLSIIKFNTLLGLWPEWNLFRNDNPLAIVDLQIEVELISQRQYGLEILNEQPGKSVLRCDDCLLSADADWNKVKLNLFDGGDVRSAATYKILNALIFTHLSTRHAIEMHASVIQIADTGVMFLGPSGIGKTTQAELWMQYRGADIINGDMVFVKQESDYFFGCGSPWHGSSPYCLNRQVPLAALIVLKQNSENSIRRLKGFEMVSAVMNSVFFPTWYKKGHEAVCKTLDVLLKTVPVYELSCRPDEDAVRLTEETVFGKPVI